jgi:hypothetical protein
MLMVCHQQICVCVCVCMCEICSVYGYMREAYFRLHLHADKRITAVFLYELCNT